MFTVDIDKGSSSDIGHAGTAEDVLNLTRTDRYLGVASCVTFITATIDVTANSYLRL